MRWSHTSWCAPGENGQLNLVLRSSAQEATVTSTYKGKRVELENSSINIILYVRKTTAEKKMLAPLVKAIDLWWQKAQEFIAFLDQGTKKIVEKPAGRRHAQMAASG
jgi:acetone carboxylase gamma subunit